MRLATISPQSEYSMSKIWAILFTRVRNLPKPHFALLTRQWCIYIAIIFLSKGNLFPGIVTRVRLRSWAQRPAQGANHLSFTSIWQWELSEIVECNKSSILRSYLSKKTLWNSRISFSSTNPWLGQSNCRLLPSSRFKFWWPVQQET